MNNTTHQSTLKYATQEELLAQFKEKKPDSIPVFIAAASCLISLAIIFIF